MNEIQFTLALPSVGEHIQDFMDEFDIKAPSLSKTLKISRSRLQRVLEGQRCDGDLALRLARAFGTTPQFWLNLQSQYDLSSAQAEARADIASIRPIEAA